MNARAALLPLLLVLAAGGAAAWLLLGEGLGVGLDGAGERSDAVGEDGTALGGPGAVALDASGTAPRKPRVEPATEEPAGPAKPAFPPAEGVSGRVVDARRKPIAGATVTLHPFPLETSWWDAPDAEPVADAKTEKDGTFLVGPAPTGRIKVRAVAPGFAPNVQPLPQRGARIEIVLDEGGALDVKVVDGKAVPVADATVQHTAGSWGVQIATVGTTSKDGVAHFDALPTGSGRLLVSKPGLGAVRQQDVGIAPKAKNELTIVLQGGRELTGVVTSAEDNRPVAGVTIDVSYPYVSGIKAPPTVTTAEDGRYRTLVDVGQGENFVIVAKHAQFAEARLWLNYNDSGNGSMQQNVKLSTGTGGLTGRILGKDGSTVAGATVSYGSMFPGQTPPSTTSDAEGRFELPATAWAQAGAQLQVLAYSSSEGVGSVWAQLPQKNEARAKPVDVRLSGGGSLDGTVKDGAGVGVAGAAVSIAMDWDAMQRQAQAQGGRGVDWMALNALQDPKVSGRLTAVTDEQGRFAIAGVPAAMYQLSALWGALQATHPEAVEVAARGTAHVDLVLGEGLTIEGVVLDGEDRPVPGATIYAQAAQQRAGMVQTWPNARSQSDGRFELRNVGASQTYVVYGSAAGYGNDQAQNVAAGTRDVTLHLKAMGWIEGQVSLDGEPLAGTFTIAAARKSEGRGGSDDEEGESSNWRGGRWGGGGRSQLFSAADGRFVLRGVAGGNYALSASTPDGLVVLEPPTVTVVDGRGAGPVRLALLRGAVLKGDVEGVDGKPLANAWIWVYPIKAEEGRNAPSGSSRTDEKGAFFVRGLGSGAYGINVSSDQVVPWTERVDLQTGEERRLHLVERPPGRVRVTVVDAQGTPLAKVQPVLTDATGNQSWPNWSLLMKDGIIDGRTPGSWERATQTDASGVCLRYHVAPGRYQVSAQAEGYGAPADPPWVDVASSSVTDVTITLTAATPK